MSSRYWPPSCVVSRDKAKAVEASKQVTGFDYGDPSTTLFFEPELLRRGACGQAC